MQIHVFPPQCAKFRYSKPRSKQKFHHCNIPNQEPLLIGCHILFFFFVHLPQKMLYDIPWNCSGQDDFFFKLCIDFPERVLLNNLFIFQISNKRLKAGYFTFYSPLLISLMDIKKILVDAIFIHFHATFR